MQSYFLKITCYRQQGEQDLDKIKARMNGLYKFVSVTKISTIYLQYNIDKYIYSVQMICKKNNLFISDSLCS
jgi:hypothetical protein